MKFINRLFAIVTTCSLIILVVSCSIGKGELEYLESAKQYSDEGKYREAIIELKNVLQMNPDNTEARLLLARSYLALNDGPSAEKEISQSERRGAKKADLIVLKLQAYLAQGNYEEVIKLFEAGETALTENQILTPLIAEAYLGINNLELADKYYRKHLASVDNDIRSLIGLGKIALKKSEFDIASDYFYQASGLDDRNRDVWRLKAEIDLKQLKYAEAQGAYEKVIALNQNQEKSNADLMDRSALIQILLAQKKVADVKNILATLEAMYAKHPITLYLSGLYHYLEKDFDTAERYLSEVLVKIPNHMPTHLLLGAVQFAQKNYEQANELLSRFVTNMPSHMQARKLLGETRLRLNKPKDALDALTAVDDEKDWQLLTMIGSAASQSGDQISAAEYMRRAVEAKPDNAALREELAKVYLRQGANEQAIQELESIDPTLSEKTNKLLLYAYIKNNDFAKARELSDLQIKVTNQSAAALTMRGMIEVIAGERVAGRGYYYKALDGDKDYLPALFALARLDLEDDRLRDAENRLSQILAVQPTNARAMLGLAQLSEKQGETENALDWLGQARAADQKALAPRLILARYFIQNKQMEMADVLLTEIKDIDSENATYLTLMGNLEFQNKQYASAAEHFAELTDKYPDSLAGFLLLAKSQFRLNNISSAKQSIQKALAINPNHLQAQLVLIELHLAQNEYTSAEMLANRLIENKQTEQLGQLTLATIYQKKGEITQAIAVLEGRFDQNESFALIKKLADLYLNTSNNAKAVTLYEEWLQKNPDHKAARLSLAAVHQAHGHATKASEIYEAILKEGNQNVIALNNQALLVFETDPEKALSYAKAAYAKAANIPAIADTYGWLLFKSGEIEQGSKIIESIAETADDPSILYHYAVILEQRGSREQALRVLERALADKEFSERKLALALKEKISVM